MDAARKQPLDDAGRRRDPAPVTTRLSAIVNSSDDAIVGKTLDGLITSWNPAAERLYGYPAEEIIGQPVTTLCPPDRVSEVTDILARIGRGERVLHHETVRQRQDGTTFPVSVTVSPVYDDEGRLIGSSSISRDISEQQRAVELRRRSADLARANQNLEAFTYSVSHDLRAPLRALGGFSAALLEDCWVRLGEDGRGYVERIRDASDQMAKLLDDLVDLSRVSRAEVRLQAVDLGAEAASIAAELQRSDPGRCVTFAIQQPARARADARLIRTVLQNLLDNAWKFTAHRDEPRIEFAAMPAGDVAAGYYVRDNGAGFDPAYAGKLFNAFQRLHTEREFPGTGIGLASVRQIVERHGGRVWAEGAVEAGATIYFTLDGEETEWRTGPSCS